MQKLVVRHNTIDYYGFFKEPALDLIGEFRSVIKLLYGAFSNYGVGIPSFRVEGEGQELGGVSINTRLGLRGVYKFRFDHVVLTLNDFSSEQLATFFETVQVADEHLRQGIADLSFKTHAFLYTGHMDFSEGTSVDFFRSLPPSGIPVYGEDLGSGLIQSWRDVEMDAKCSLTLDHSAQFEGGIFISYKVIIERDQIDYIPLAVAAQQNLYKILGGLGLEIDEEATT
jgi:hypothetical protein